MAASRVGLAYTAVVFAVSFVTYSSAVEPSRDPAAEALTELVGAQHILKLPVRVVDEQGHPVANAKVAPWALRSSQGHGLWREGDKAAGVGPEAVTTDANGVATVLYPRFENFEEQIRTISVSLAVDHPEFAYVNDLHIDVPLETSGPYEIKLTRGIPVKARPLINGEPTDLDSIYPLWSDGRSWQPGVVPEKLADGALRIPAMSPGKNSILLVNLDDDRPTHFSRILDLELEAGETKTLDIELQPAVRIEGVLSDNVPRPVRNGRAKVRSLRPAIDYHRVDWFTWAPVRSDGTFTIEAWPADEPLQLIALCDGYIATSGAAPDVVVKPPDPDHDSFCRPQIFQPQEQIEVAMTPLVRCEVSTVNDAGEPVAGVKVSSWPNVGWWNDGSQIYCNPLVRGERLLHERDYQQAIDEAFPYPFECITDAAGNATLELPAGSEDLEADSDDYEMPVFLGRREQRVKLTQGETTKAVLHLQPRRTDRLGEWDKMAGVVFGCSTREGRRICALPAVRRQMDEFVRKLREAENPRDPKLLAEAYAAVADAFTEAGDPLEAAKWRQKSAEQAARAHADAAGPAATN